MVRMPRTATPPRPVFNRKAGSAAIAAAHTAPPQPPPCLHLGPLVPPLVLRRHCIDCTVASPVNAGGVALRPGLPGGAGAGHDVRGEQGEGLLQQSRP